VGQTQACGCEQQRWRGGVLAAGKDVDDDRGGTDALIESLSADSFDRHQAIVANAAQNLNHLPIDIIAALQLAPDRGHRRWQHPVLERGTIAQSARFADKNRHIMPRIIGSLASTERTRMVAHNHSILPDNDPVSIGMHIDRPTDRRGQHRVSVVVEPHRAGL